MPISSNAQNEVELFSFVKDKSTDAQPASIAAETQQSIEINFNAVNSKAAKTLRLPLLDGLTYDVKQTEKEGFISRGEDDYTWRGKLKEDDKWTGDVILTVKGKAMSGLIFAPSGTYEIIPQKDFTHVLVKIDPSLFPRSKDDGVIPPNLDDSKPLILNDEYNSFKFSSMQGKAYSTPQISTLDNGTLIDVLIVYTAAVRTRLGGVEQVQAIAQQAITYTNIAYENSGISTHLRLVQTMEVSYADNGTTSDALNWVTNDATVAAARNSAKADLVSMFTENATDDCGRGWIMGTNNANFERYGFSTVQRSCAVGNLTFAHEIGHNQGSNHNPENAISGSNIYPYNYGHWNATGGFITVMSYFDPCPSCSRILYFSNPTITYGNFSVGIPNERDNARVINNTALTVSQFRESGGGSNTCITMPIAFGETINGSLENTDCIFDAGSGYTDRYTFHALAGQSIAVSMNSSAFDSYLLLISSTGQILSVDDNGGGGTNSRIPANSGFFNIKSTGTYIIQATSSSANSVGQYSLTLSSGNGPPTSTPTPTPTPTPGNNNPDTAGVFRPSNGITYLRNSNTGGFADIDFIYGVNGDTSIAGDWDGDGKDSLGIYRNGLFYLRNTNSTGPADIVFAFGDPTDQPIAGDWDGDGIDTIGLYRRSTGVFILRNSNSAGSPDTVFVLGNPNDIAIAGDWNGDGIDTTGVFRPSNGIIYLKNQNTTGDADIYLVYGNAGDKPLAGDWDGDGKDSVGIYRNGVMYLRNSNSQGFADIVFAFGNPGDEPIAGDWDGLP